MPTDQQDNSTDRRATLRGGDNTGVAPGASWWPELRRERDPTGNTLKQEEHRLRPGTVESVAMETL